jgi:hypothetical protein
MSVAVLSCGADFAWASGQVAMLPQRVIGMLLLTAEVVRSQAPGPPPISGCSNQEQRMTCNDGTETETFEGTWPTCASNGGR